ncbi:MAG: glycerol-3-phosphate 1-O-acyltransferase PlsY [Burkholderiales bacterium]|nr:glycerol-3-phosphate 1-O-acyltransferase PlsY [Burkholderiales bacterium]
MVTVVVAIVAYLVGSLSFAVIVSRLYGLPDPHTYGSGNPGATNVLRTGRRSAAALTLLGDALKGFVVVWVARHFAADWGLDVDGIALAALAVFAGHLFPVYFGFKGGKGVATAAGILLALSPWLGLAVGAVWLIVLGATRYSSGSSLAAAAAAPVLSGLILGWNAIAVAVLAMTALIFYRHRANIRRLLAGTESKVGSRG